jgi:hypothetical protein
MYAICTMSCRPRTPPQGEAELAAQVGADVEVRGSTVQEGVGLWVNGKVNGGISD